MPGTDANDDPVVVNRHHYRGKEIPRPWRYIGRGSPLGNPFAVAEHGASAALEKYRRWLWEQMQDPGSGVSRALRSIRPGERLVCSCTPRPCHGDVIVAAWRWLRGLRSPP